MYDPEMHSAVFERLIARPSRASVAAIGHRFVLNGSPPSLRIRGIDAVKNMACDWSVAILEEAIRDAGRGYLVKRYALENLCRLLIRAVDRGYRRITRQDALHLEAEAKRELTLAPGELHDARMEAVEEVCNHVSQAIDDGLFPRLSDF